LQLVPSVAFGFEQLPVLGSHVPATWHWSSAEQVLPVPLVHEPLWHVSFSVHALPSLQLESSLLLGFEHCPFAGSQVPATWHWSSAEQVTLLPPVHEPLWQVSVCVTVAVVAAQALSLMIRACPLAGSQVPATWH
jgi:hypothetical protein